MRLIVLPLSALHASGPYQYRDLVQGLLVHMVIIGLPISFSVGRFAKEAGPNWHPAGQMRPCGQDSGYDETRLKYGFAAGRLIWTNEALV